MSRNYRNTVPEGFLSNDGTFNSASVGLQLTVPIYQGGRVAAQVRQSKESLGQARIEVDVTRDQVRVCRRFGVDAIRCGAPKRRCQSGDWSRLPNWR